MLFLLYIDDINNAITSQIIFFPMIVVVVVVVVVNFILDLVSL